MTRRRIFLLILLAAPAFGVYAGEAGYVPRAIDLLDRPTADAKPVGRLIKQQPVEVIGRNGSWANVTAGARARSGWIRMIDVRLNTAPSRQIATVVRVKSASDSGIRGFSKEELLAGTPSRSELDKLKGFSVAAKEAAQNPPPDKTSADGTGNADAGHRAEQLRAAREQAKAAKQRNDEMMRNLRKDPQMARALDESDKKHKESMHANPSGVQSQFNLGDREEASLGLEMVPALIGEQKLLDDPALLGYLNSVGMWVAQQSERPGLPWRFAVIDTDSVNAFAVPGGYVFVTRGMLDLLETESELAGGFGHEISHVVRKHHLRWVYVNKDMQADTDGATLAWRAGYEAWGLVSALQRFEAYQRPRYAALHAAPTDHPEPLQRLKMLDLALRARAEKDTLGDVGGERYLAATRSLRNPGN